MDHIELVESDLTIIEIRLKEVRENLQLTQKSVASSLGISRSLLALWENGHANISLKKLVKLASFYQVPIDYILDIIHTVDKKKYIYKSELDLVYLGSKIKEIRKLNKMTQEKFAKVLHTKRSNISYYESGRYTISTSDLKEICETFGISADYMIGNLENFTKREKITKIRAKNIKEAILGNKKVEI